MRAYGIPRESFGNGKGSAVVTRLSRSDHEMDSHRRDLSRDRTRIIVIVKSAITEIFPASECLTSSVESRYKFANLIPQRFNPRKRRLKFTFYNCDLSKREYDYNKIFISFYIAYHE